MNKRNLIMMAAVSTLCGCSGMNFSYSLSYNMPAVACQANTLLCSNPTIVQPVTATVATPVIPIVTPAPLAK